MSAQGLVGLILRYDILWYIHPSCPQFLPRAWKRSCLRPASVSPLPSSSRNQKPLLNVPRKCSWLARKKRKKTDAWAAQARKEVAPQPRGHLTTRRQLPIGRGMCPHHTSCSNSSACTPFLLLTYRSTIAELRSRSWREGGSAQRSLALVSARCKGCFYDAECSATYTADAHTLLCATHRSLRKK